MKGDLRVEYSQRCDSEQVVMHQSNLHHSTLPPFTLPANPTTSTCYEIGNEWPMPVSPAFYDAPAGADTDAKRYFCSISCSQVDDYQFAGLYMEEFCFCSNQLPNLESVQKNQGCQNADQISVYEVKIVKKFTPMLVKTDSQFVEINQPVDFQIIYPPDMITSVQDAITQVYVGDTYHLTEQASSLLYGMTLTYPKLGEQWTVFHAVNSKGQIVSSGAKSVHVYEQIDEKSITLKCPEKAVQDREIKCSLNVGSGSNVIGTIDIADQKEIIHLSDPDMDWIRMPARRLTGELKQCQQSQLLRILGNQAKYSGTVSSINFHASRPGSFTLIHVRPNCQGRNLYYSYNKDTCVQHPWTGVVCPDAYSPTVANCIQNPPGALFLRPLKLGVQPNPPAGYQFDKLVSIPIKVEKEGWQVFRLDSPLKVESGDSLGVEPDGNLPLYCANPTYLQDFDLFEDSGSNSLAKTHDQIQIGAMVRLPHIVDVIGTFKQSGVQSVAASLSCCLDTTVKPNEVKVQADIQVLEKLKNAVLTETNFPMGQEVDLQLTLESGVPTKLIWTIGSQDQPGHTVDTTTSINQKLRYVFIKLGNYPVSVNVSNELEFLMADFKVKAIQPIQFNGIDIDPDAQVGVEAIINLRISQGSDYQCVMTVDNDQHPDMPQTNTSDNRIQYTFKQAGTFSLSINCSTPINSQIQSASQVVEEGISGLKLITKNLPVEEEVRIEYRFTTGTNMDVEMTYGNQQVEAVIDYTRMLIQSTPVVINEIGSVQVAISTANRVNEAESTDPIEFNVPIGEIRVTVDDSKVIFKTTIERGTSVTIRARYGDNSGQTFDSPQCQPWDNSRTSINHIYTKPGQFNCTLSAEAGGKTASTWLLLSVYDRIGPYRIESSSPGSQMTASTNQPFSIKLIPEDVDKQAYGAQLALKWGDQSPPFYEAFQSSAMPYQHVYRQAGTYDIDVTLSNALNAVTTKSQVKVAQPASWINCQCSPNALQPSGGSDQSIVDQTTLEADWDKVNEANIKLSYGDGRRDEEIVLPTEPRLVKNISYNQPGSYQLTLTLSGQAWSIQCQCRLTVQLPVTRFAVTIDDGINLKTTDQSFLTINYLGAVDSFATNPQLTIDWNVGGGGGGSSGDKESMAISHDELPRTISHTRSSCGQFLVQAVLSNAINNQTFSQKVKVYAPIGRLALRVLVDSSNSPGYGPAGNRYAKDQQLRLELVDLSVEGDNLNESSFTIRRLEGDSSNVDATPTLKKSFMVKSFKQLGTYRIRGSALNPYSSLTEVNLDIVIATALRGLSITPIDGPLIIVNQQHRVEIGFESRTPDTCVCINRPESSLGNSLILVPTSGQSKCQACPQQDGSIEVAHQLATANDANPLSFNLAYSQPGTYIVGVTAAAVDGEIVSQELSVVVIDDQQKDDASSCSPPQVSLLDPSIGSPANPIQVKVGWPVVLRAKVVAVDNCYVNLTLQWTVQRVDWNSLQPIDGGNVDDVADWPTAQTRELTVPGRLPSGLYACRLEVEWNVSTSSAELVRQSTTAYLQVNQLSIVIQFESGRPWRRSFGLTASGELCLDPEANSYDPNMVNRSIDQGIGNWKWSCELLTNLVTQTLRTGPCFTNIDVSGHKQGRLCIPSREFKPDLSYYKFTVSGSKPDYGEASDRIIIEPMQGSQPSLQVGCQPPELCQLPQVNTGPFDAWLVASDNDLFLGAKLAAHSQESEKQIKYHWSVSRLTVSTNLLAPLGQSTIDQSIQGSQTDLLRIDRGISSLESSGTFLEACAGNTGGGGHVCLLFKYTQPVKRGTCSAKQDRKGLTVNVKCQGFSSRYPPLSYLFSLDDSRFIGLSLTESVELRLPRLVKPRRLCYSIMDQFSNKIDACFADLEAMPEGDEKTNSLLKELVEGNETIITGLLETGSDRDKSNLINQLESFLNEDDDGSGSEVYRVLSSIPFTLNTFKVTSQLVDVLTSIIPTDDLSFLLAASTLEGLVSKGRDLDRASQLKLANYVSGTMLTAFSGTTVKLNPSVVQKMLDYNLAASIGLTQASNEQIVDPVPNDVDKDFDSLYYDVDLEAPALDGSVEQMTDQLIEIDNAVKQKHVAISSLAATIKSYRLTGQSLQAFLPTGGRPIVSQLANQAQSEIVKVKFSDLNGLQVKQDQFRSSVTFNNVCHSHDPTNQSCDHSVVLQTLITQNNLFQSILTPSDHLPIPNNSATVTVTLLANNSRLAVNGSRGLPFEFFIAKAVNFTLPTFKSVSQLVTRPQLPEPRRAIDGSEVYQALLVSRLSLPPNQRVGLTYQLRPEKPKTCPQYLVIVRLVKAPIISREGGDFDFWQMLPKDTSECASGNLDKPDEADYAYSLLLNSSQLEQARLKAVERWPDKQADLVFIGYRQLVQSQELNAYPPTTKPPIPYPFRDQIVDVAKTRIFASSCVSLNTEELTEWTTDGCVVGPKTTIIKTHCLCSHLSTFASGWFELPNELDFDYIFANIDFARNPTIYATEIAIAALFLLIAIWARHKDRKDLQKIGVTPLAENDPDHEYLYELIVSTGQRHGAGTDSKVCILLSGELDETEPRVLQDSHRKVLQRGNFDRFLLACRRSLGSLIYARLWHDNSGKGGRASWYCNFVKVVDLQTSERVHFIVDRWFAVEEDDGQIDRLIPVSNEGELLAFSHMFTTGLSRELADDHLWLSIMARPVTSRFTRVERTGVCLLLLFLSMLTSAMFYKGEGVNVKQVELLTVGPIAIGPQELFIALLNNLITFVPVLLICYVFRNCELYASHARKLRQLVEFHLDEEIDLDRLPAPSSSTSAVNNLGSEELDSSSNTSTHPRSAKRYWPWQLRIATWILLLGCLAVSVAFTTFYGVSFGNAACQKWLSSMFISFFINLIVTQPIKVLLLVAFLSLVCKSSSSGQVNDIEVLVDEDRLMQGLARRYQARMDEAYLHDAYLGLNFKPRRLRIVPPDPEVLERARVYRRKQLQANDIIREIIFYILFLILLLAVTLNLHDPSAYYMKNNLQKTLFPASIYSSISSDQDFYDWLAKTFLPAIRARRWYNGSPPLFQRGFLADRVSRMIGYVMMRQVRVKPNSCKVYPAAKVLTSNCYASYSIAGQDESNYSVGWAVWNKSQPTSAQSSSFTYTKSSQINGQLYPGKVTWYSGGGYLHLFRGSLENMQKELVTLQQGHWIDFGTRAIIIQFTVYNPNLNLFGIVTGLVELPGTGTLLPNYRIEIANLYGIMGGKGTGAEITIVVLYVLALIGYLIKEVRRLLTLKLAYFARFWTYIELFIIFGSFTSIAFYAYTMHKTLQAVAQFTATQGNAFINFQSLAYFSEGLTYSTALICFAATLKLVRLLRFNQRVSLLGSVLQAASKDLYYFGIVFTIMFMAFVLTFYILYSNTLHGFRTVLSSVETSMQIVLGKFDFTAMYEREMILGPLLFALFTLTIIFIMINMFIAILDESFQRVLGDIHLQSDEHAITQFILGQFLAWSGLGRFERLRQWVGSTSCDAPTALTNLKGHYDDLDDDLADSKVNGQVSERQLARQLTDLVRTMDDVLGLIEVNHLSGIGSLLDQGESIDKAKEEVGQEGSEGD